MPAVVDADLWGAIALLSRQSFIYAPLKRIISAKGPLEVTSWSRKGREGEQLVICPIVHLGRWRRPRPRLIHHSSPSLTHAGWRAGGARLGALGRPASRVKWSIAEAAAMAFAKGQLAFQRQTPMLTIMRGPRGVTEGGCSAGAIRKPTMCRIQSRTYVTRFLF